MPTTPLSPTTLDIAADSLIHYELGVSSDLINITGNNGLKIGDGTINLYEFAYGLNPTQSDAPPKPQLALNNGNIELTYIRGSLAIDDLWFTVPWTETLNGTDWTYDEETEEILSDNGTQQTVKAIIPMGTSGRRFVRLEIHSFD